MTLTSLATQWVSSFKTLICSSCKVCRLLPRLVEMGVYLRLVSRRGRRSKSHLWAQELSFWPVLSALNS